MSLTSWLSGSSDWYEAFIRWNPPCHASSFGNYCSFRNCSNAYCSWRCAKAAQEAWCDALVAISRAHAKGGLRVKQPSVKLLRDQFPISSEITQPSTILASRLESLVSSGALGWFVDQRSLCSKFLVTHRMLWVGFILRLLIEPEVKWRKPLDMCATMMAPCVLLFTIHQAFYLAIDVDYRSNWSVEAQF